MTGRANDDYSPRPEEENRTVPKCLKELGISREVVAGAGKAMASQQGTSVSEERRMLPETYTDPKSRLENLAEPDSPGVNQGAKVSDLREDLRFRARSGSSAFSFLVRLSVPHCAAFRGKVTTRRRLCCGDRRRLGVVSR
jgi:hypothetical protein